MVAPLPCYQVVVVILVTAFSDCSTICVLTFIKHKPYQNTRPMILSIIEFYKSLDLTRPMAFLFEFFFTGGGGLKK